MKGVIEKFQPLKGKDKISVLLTMPRKNAVELAERLGQEVDVSPAIDRAEVEPATDVVLRNALSRLDDIRDMLVESLMPVKKKGFDAVLDGAAKIVRVLNASEAPETTEANHNNITLPEAAK